jgi:hypothetical protein
MSNGYSSLDIIKKAPAAFLLSLLDSVFDTVNGSAFAGPIAIYCRVSTDDQSCERQERDLRAFAKRAGHKIVGVFKETARSRRA